MKVKTSELQGAALDWAVAKCEDVPAVHIVLKPGKTCVYGEVDGVDFPYQPHTDWPQAGPIIAENRISILARSFSGKSDWWASAEPYDSDNEDDRIGYEASDPLTAAMRCFVASKLGDEVDIPDELMS